MLKTTGADNKPIIDIWKYPNTSILDVDPEMPACTSEKILGILSKSLCNNTPNKLAANHIKASLEDFTKCVPWNVVLMQGDYWRSSSYERPHYIVVNSNSVIAMCWRSRRHLDAEVPCQPFNQHVIGDCGIYGSSPDKSYLRGNYSGVPPPIPPNEGKADLGLLCSMPQYDFTVPSTKEVAAIVSLTPENSGKMSSVKVEPLKFTPDNKSDENTEVCPDISEERSVEKTRPPRINQRPLELAHLMVQDNEYMMDGGRGYMCTYKGTGETSKRCQTCRRPVSRSPTGSVLPQRSRDELKKTIDLEKLNNGSDHTYLLKIIKLNEELKNDIEMDDLLNLVLNNPESLSGVKDKNKMRLRLIAELLKSRNPRPSEVPLTVLEEWGKLFLDKFKNYFTHGLDDSQLFQREPVTFKDDFNDWVSLFLQNYRRKENMSGEKLLNQKNCRTGLDPEIARRLQNLSRVDENKPLRRYSETKDTIQFPKEAPEEDWGMRFLRSYVKLGGDRLGPCRCKTDESLARKKATDPLRFLTQDATSVAEDSSENSRLKHKLKSVYSKLSDSSQASITDREIRRLASMIKKGKAPKNPPRDHVQAEVEEPVRMFDRVTRKSSLTSTSELDETTIANLPPAGPRLSIGAFKIPKKRSKENLDDDISKSPRTSPPDDSYDLVEDSASPISEMIEWPYPLYRRMSF